MKKAFEQASETPAERRERLQNEIDALEKELKSPKPPSLTLQPKGMTRYKGNEIGRAAMRERRNKLSKDLKDHDNRPGQKRRDRGDEFEM
ncbi:MAG: hypothetical protein AAGH90_04505 [Pseudomonadota bacterium]